MRGLRRIAISAEDSPIWRRLRRNISISVLGAVLILPVKLVQTALLTRFLGINDYGRVLIVINFFVFLDSFFALNVNDVMFRFFQPLRERQDHRALNRLLVFCLTVSVASGVLIWGIPLALSSWLVDRIYPGLGLTVPFNIYGCTAVVSALSGFYQPILRIHDRVTSIVAPQIVGNLVTLAIFGVHFAASDGYNLNVIIAAFAIGVFIQSVPPLVQALRIVKPFLRNDTQPAGAPPEQHGPRLGHVLFSSNLSRYLRVGLNPGDLFFLSLFSSPAQVGLYGLAKQLTAPLSLLATNTQTAITPEITTLVAQRKIGQLRRFLRRYVASAAILSALLVIGAFVTGPMLLSAFVQPQQADALPVLLVLIGVVGIQLVFLVFRPLAVSLDFLRSYNVGMFLSSCAAITFALVAGLSAFSMACIQLGDVVIVRPVSNALLWMHLKRLPDNT
jgi:O-antigen/teichoic acid export membrane protein